MANWFNNFFVDIDPKLALLIPESQKKLTSFQTHTKPSWVEQTLLMMK